MESFLTWALPEDLRSPRRVNRPHKIPQRSLGGVELARSAGDHGLHSLTEGGH
jgi:hypothetical protein